MYDEDMRNTSEIKHVDVLDNACKMLIKKKIKKLKKKIKKLKKQLKKYEDKETQRCEDA